MKVILWLSIFWTLYGIAGILGFQVINEKYKNHDWTGSYIRRSGISWLMLGIPWLIIYLLSHGKDISWLLLLCAVPSVVYTMVNEQKYRHMQKEDSHLG